MRTPPNERLTSDTADTPRPRKSEPAASCPERRCILSRETAQRDALVRLAVSPDGEVLPDVLAKAPGRGAWLGATRAELEQALAKGRLRGALAHAFKGASLSVPDDLPDRIEAALSRALLDRLGLAMRAGHLILGSERISDHARGGKIGLLLHALDASEDGRRKLDQAWRVGSDAEGSGKRGIVLPLDRAALSVALGRDNIVHLGLTGRTVDDGAAGRVMRILARLLHYRGESPDGLRSDSVDRSASAIPDLVGDTLNDLKDKRVL